MSASWTPGAYLAARRRAAGLSIDDVAAHIRTSPHIDERRRRLWLASIEADVVPVPGEVVHLRELFPFDAWILAALEQAQSVPRLCRSCACSHHDPCLEASTGAFCAWAEEDLCTACAARPALTIITPVDGASA